MCVGGGGGRPSSGGGGGGKRMGSQRFISIPFIVHNQKSNGRGGNRGAHDVNGWMGGRGPLALQ